MKGVTVQKSLDINNEVFPVVAIGASAGGIEAIKELLGALAPKTGMCFIYIQHMGADHESKLPEVITRATKMPVQEAMEGMKLRPDHLYIIPPNREMAVVEGKLKLSIRPSRPKNHLPINQFFSSLAEQYKEKAIGILLSGNPPDGTIGMKAIKAAGGITFAQDGSARFEGMAKNAIQQEAVDLVLSPGKIAEEISKLSEHFIKYQEALHEIESDVDTDNDESINGIIKQVYQLIGSDFGHYKKSTIKRRMIRRMILHKMESLEDYLKYLKTHTNEVHHLYQDLLINVTSFFRDAETTDYLKKSMLPKMIGLKANGEAIRIWVPGCSTGQEAYTLAILLMEILGEKAATTSVQIFATDLSELAVNKARLGIYSKDEVAEVSPRRLNLYFTKIDGSYRIIKGIRDMCVFATHNVLKDPPFSRLDLVSCCNLLIYLEPVLQKKVLSTFHYSLNSFGYLVIGKSETTGSASNLFTHVDKHYKVFAKKKEVTSKPFFELSFRNAEGNKHDPRKLVLPKNKAEDIDLDKSVDQVLLARYSPACVVVTNDLDIVQFRGSTGLFLEPSPGRASLNLLKMARPALGIELRSLIHKASKTGDSEEKSWIENGKDNIARKIFIEAVPIGNETAGIEKYFLVTFREENLPANDQPHSFSKDKRVKQLEDELRAMREDMRSIVEEQEAANEELQSVNEEIVSSNEELQSINEELETSKEELESSNEELITINQELQMRNEQLAEIQEYSEAVFTTIRESLLILDKDLRIKNANNMFYTSFGLREEHTEGKLLYDVGDKQWNIPRLKELLEEIIPRNSQINDFEVVHTFPAIGEKVMVVNARRLVRKLHSEHLILLAIEDITEYKKARHIIRESEEWFKDMADNSPVMIWRASAEKTLEYVNEAWLECRQHTYDEAIGKSWVEEMVQSDEKRVKKSLEQAFASHKPFSVKYRIQIGNETKHILNKGKPNFSPAKEFIGYIGSCIEIKENEV